MAKQTIEITGGVTGLGDDAPTGAGKINSNFTELYNVASTSDEKAALGAANTPTALNPVATIADIPTNLLTLGETNTNAYRGDRGKTAYDHSQVAHAPSDAQKNSDITKAEIEAKLTGVISSHSHAGGGVTSWGSISGTLSNQTDLQTALDLKLTQSSADALYSGISHSHTNLPTTNEKAALTAANAPTALNPFATEADLISGSSNTQMLYNNSGVVSGTASLVYDNISDQLTSLAPTSITLNSASPSTLLNPVLQTTTSVDNYTQISLQNKSSAGSASSDIIVYPNNVSAASDTGFMDMGIASSNFSDPLYAVTAANEGYLFMSAPPSPASSGNLIIATDISGTDNDIAFFTSGFDDVANERLRIKDAEVVSQVKITVPDEAYNTTSWNGDFSVPTKNSIRDALQITPAQAANYSTGLVYGAVVTTNVSGVGINITAGLGTVLDAYTDPANPVVYFVSIPARTNVIPPDLATNTSRHVGIDKNGNVVWGGIGNEFSVVARRDTIVIGWVDSLDFATITASKSQPAYSVDIGNQFRDAFLSLGKFNIEGNDYSAASTNLTIKKTLGSTFSINANQSINPKSPHVIASAAENPVSFVYYYQTAPNVWNNTLPSGTTINPNQYDTGSGLASVPTGKWTIQVIGLYPDPVYNDIQYGQAVYDTLAIAKQSVSNTININPYLEPDSFRTYLFVKQGATNLSDPTQAEFFNAGTFGLFGGGGSSGASSGSVLSVGVANANGFNGSVTNSTTTPVISVSTTVTGITKGDGTSLSAATVGTDYSVGTSSLSTGIIKSTTGTGALSTATVGVDYSVGTSSLSTGIIKSTTGTGSLSTAAAGVDYSGGTSALPTGIVKSTTSTGALTIATAGDFPTLNQNTTGTSAAWTVGRTISLTGDVTGVSGALDGTANLSFATSLATAQPTAHTWALAQTFTTAPVFTDQPNTRSALGLGSLATQSVVGNISNSGAIGVTANLPLITTTSGVVTVGTFGTGANTFCQGNDARLSDARNPLSHTHGNITNAGAIGATANLPVITTTAGALTTGTFGTGASTFCQGNDSRLSDSRTPLAHVHAAADVTSGTFADARVAQTSITQHQAALSIASTQVTGTKTNTFISDFSAAALAAAPAETAITLGSVVNGAVDKSTPVDADNVTITDSAASHILKKVTWANIKATLKTYFDTLYAAVAHPHSATDITSGVLAADRLATGTGSQFLRRNAGNTALEFATLAGGGDVLKVGTPVDNQVGVWTGNGTIEGTSNLLWDNSASTLTINGTDPEILMTGITTEPSAPSTGIMAFYAKAVSGRMFPKWKGVSGLDVVAQPALFNNTVVWWMPTTATAGLWIGTAGAGAGTYTTALPTTTNIYTAIKRARWANVITTTNQVLGQRNTENMFFIGSAAGQGGFFFCCRFGLDSWTAGSRLFVGLATSTTVISANPSSLNNTVGFCIDAGDTAITFLTRNATTATKATIAGQPALAANNGYTAYIFCPPNSSTIYYRLDNLNTGVTLVDTSTTTTVPVSNTLLSANVLASNAANTAATAVNLGVSKIYIETDN